VKLRRFSVNGGNCKSAMVGMAIYRDFRSFCALIERVLFYCLYPRS